MEVLFTYETAKETIVMTAYWLLILLDIWWIGYIIKSIGTWLIKKIKKLVNRKKTNSDAVNNENNM